MPIFAPFSFLEQRVIVVEYDTDAEAFFNAAGITDTTQKDAINGLVVDLKGAGIWTKIDAIYPFVGGTATTHKYNLKDPQDTDAAYRLTFTNSPTHNSDGVEFDGVNQWADTYLNINTQLNGGSGQNDNHMFCSYFKTSADNGLDIGVAGPGVNAWHLNSRNASNVFNTRNMSSGLNSDSPFTATSGVFGMSRTSSTGYTKYFNKSSYSHTQSSVTPASLTVYIGCQNADPTPANFNNRGFNLISMGGGLTTAEWEDFVDINTTYQNALSR